MSSGADDGDETVASAVDFEQNNGETPLLSHPNDENKPSERLSIARLWALTCICGGLQVFFSTITANLSPYLQKLGLSKSATAVIIICLPLSGAFVGPLAGAFSDRLRTRWGRRRPILFGGAILTASFLLLLAWTEQLVRAIGGKSQSATAALALTWTLLMSVSVQPVQAGVRSLIVDVAPADQQDRAASWAGRIQGVCAIFSFFASSLDLPALPGLHRLTQFQALACLNLITLGTSVLVTCIFIQEKDSRSVELDGDGKQSVLAVLRHTFKTVKRLRGRIRGTCQTQFCSWFAWFPFLYYNTTYIGELAAPNMSVRVDGGGNDLAQAGSLASLNFAIVGFVMIILLPLLLPHAVRFAKRNRSQGEESDPGLRPLIWLWVCTQPLLGIFLVLTLAVAYQWQGIVLIAFAGIPWAVTQWVPFAIVGNEVSRYELTGAQAEESGGAGSKAGAIMGVHNLAISLPQVLSGLVSSATYRIAETAGSTVPTAWVLASSSIAAFVAAFLVRRML